MSESVSLASQMTESLTARNPERTPWFLLRETWTFCEQGWTVSGDGETFVQPWGDDDDDAHVW